MRAAVLLVASCLASIAHADAEQDVRCSEIAFSKSAELRDAKAFRSFIDADARFVGNSVARGPDAIIEAWSGFFAEDGPTIKWRPQFVEVLADGELALTRGPYRLTVIDEEGQISERWGTFNSVWRRGGDGNWKVVFDAGSAPDESPVDAARALLDAEDDCE